MPPKVDLDIWWSSLSIAQKERIARKALTGESGRTVVDSEVVYPACTAWWIGLSEERKAKIREHCEDRHGYLMKEWDEANAYGD